LSTDALREEIRRLGPWHHDIQVAPGVWTGEVSKDVVYPASLGSISMIRPERWLSNMVREVFPGGLNGRSVMDCACNGGGFLFAAAEHGASRAFGLDVRDHWIDQAKFVARQTGARGIEFTTADLHTLPAMELEPFDISLFMGIFYHLPDPVASLRMVADRTKELLVLNTAYLPGRGDALALNLESETLPMSGVHRLAWLPTSERVLREILGWCGFPHVRTTWRRPPHAGHFHRIELIAAREASTLAHFDASRPDALAPPPASLLRRLLRRVRRP
jgi:SAM-dependent methyltransferase